MAMVPHERSLVKRLADKPFVILGVNSDRSRERLKQVMKKHKITWRSWFDGGSSGGPIAKRWNIKGWPTIYVLDPKGVIRFKNVRGKKLDQAIETVLKELGKK